MLGKEILERNTRVKKITVFCLTLLMAIFFGSISFADDVVFPAADAASNSGCYLGIFREGAPANMSLIKDLEKKTGKKFTQIMWYQDWSMPFNANLCDKVVKHGAVPHIVWEPWLWNDKEKIKLDNIIAGEWDDHITSWAKDIKNWGKPIFIRWGHEFNIEGYPWGTVNNGRNPKKYIQAYKHVHDIFNSEGATNARWVWCPMRESWPQDKWNDMNLAYPGDDYVDWIGIDGYNWGTSQPWSSWQSFKELFRNVARDLWRKHPTKPIMIAEFASASVGGDKAKWISEITDELKKMPYIKVINWFDEKKEADWRIDSDKKSLASFGKIQKDNYFFSKSDGMINLSATCAVSLEKKTAVAAYASNAPKIDGDISEWKNVKSIKIDNICQVQEGAAFWKSPSDLSAKFYVQWDKENIYFAADVNDKNPLTNSKKKENIWNGDAIEITLGLNKNADSDRTSFDDSDFQIGLGTGNSMNNPASIWIWKPKSTPDGGGIAVKKKDDSTGYFLEAKIPWSALGGFNPSKGDVIGFDCAIDDASKKDRDKQMVWNGDFLFYKDPGVWGELEFAK